MTISEKNTIKEFAKAITALSLEERKHLAELLPVDIFYAPEPLSDSQKEALDLAEQKVAEGKATYTTLEETLDWIKKRNET